MPRFAIHVLSAVALCFVACRGTTEPELSQGLKRVLSEGRLLGTPTLGGDARSPAFDERADGFSHRASSFEARFEPGSASMGVKRADAGGLRLVPRRLPWREQPGTVLGGRLIYPAAGGGAATVLTPGQGKVKEDLVLLRPMGDRLVFEWELTLEDGLRAERVASGGIEVRAATGQRLYRIPAPEIRHGQGQLAPRQSARFELSGATLRLLTSGLEQLEYPIAIDPTVEITATADFALGGNDEGGAEIAGDRVVRGRPRSGTGAFIPAAELPSARMHAAREVYNGYLYLLGGCLDGQDNGSCNARTDEVLVAQVNADGSLGAWTPTTPLTSARARSMAVAYGGFLYLVGGAGSPTPPAAEVARINADGTLGPWLSPGQLPPPKVNACAVAHQGHLYLLGGSQFEPEGTQVHHAPIRGDGTLGSWTASTSFTLPRQEFGCAASNGFLYVAGGWTFPGTTSSSVQVAAVNPDGSLGSWRIAPPMTRNRSVHEVLVSNGFLYALGGFGAVGVAHDDLEAAPLLADGMPGQWERKGPIGGPRRRHSALVAMGHVYLLGGWFEGAVSGSVLGAPLDDSGALGAWFQEASNFAPPRQFHGMAAHRGFLYLTGGCTDDVTCANVIDNALHAPIAPDGTVGPWTASSAPFETGRWGHTTVVAASGLNGFLYVIGGRDSGGTALTSVQFAPIDEDGTVGAFSATTALPSQRGRHAFTVHNGRIYVSGGQDGANHLDEVLYAAVNPDGTLGPWTSTTPIPPRRSHAMVAYDGHLYVLGGVYATDLDEVLYARIAEDGSVGPWTSTTAFGTPRRSHASFAEEGHLWIVGGRGTSNLGDVQRAPIGEDGSIGSWATVFRSLQPARSGHGVAVSHGRVYLTGGAGPNGFQDDTLSAPLVGHGTVDGWSEAATFAERRASHAAAAHRGYLYVLGGVGAANLTLSSVEFAALQPDGSVGAFTDTTPFATARVGHAAVAHRGFLYLVGGEDASDVYLDDVQFAPLNADGTVGTWSATSPLPQPLARHVALAHQGHLYVVGGGTGSSLANTVYMAPIGPDGTLGSWTTTTALTLGRQRHTGVVHRSHLYVAGGYRSGALTLVESAPLQPDGTLGPWKTVTHLPAGRWSHAMVAADEHLYVVGGCIEQDGSCSGTVLIRDVFVAPLHPGGGLGNWRPTHPFPEGRVRMGYASDQGRIYITGGARDGPFAQDVQVAVPRVPWHRATYSRLIDLGAQQPTVDGLTVNGQEGEGSVRMSHRVAPSDGIFGPPVEVDPLVLGGPVAVGAANVRYLWARFTLQGSGAQLDDLSLSWGEDVPTRLAFSVGPTDVGVGSNLTVSVEVLDAAGDRVETSTAGIALEVASGPAGATLAGGGPVAAAGGVATFGGVSLGLAGTYTLRATSPGLTAAVSAAFEVVAATGAPPRIVTLPPGEAECGVEWRYLPEALGEGPFSWSVEGLEGAAVDGATGALTWVPHRNGPTKVTFTLRVEGKDGAEVQAAEVEVLCGEEKAYAVGCGCGAVAGGPVLALLGLLLLAGRRTRPVSDHRTPA